MIRPKDVESLTAFKRNTRECIRRIKESGSPLILTANGKAELVVQDVESYQRMLELLGRVESVEAVREGLESVRQGRTMPLDRFDKELRKRVCGPKRRQPTASGRPVSPCRLPERNDGEHD